MSERTLGDFDEPESIFKATGPPDHWITTLNAGFWGFTSDNESSWERVERGDVIVFHSTGTDTHDGSWDSGVIGYGVAGRKSRKDYPLWRSERETESNDYPYVVRLTGTYWRGDVADVSSDPVGEKTVERIHDDIEALLRNRLTLSETKDETGDRFPVMGSFNEPTHGSKYVELLREEPLTTVRYRRTPDSVDDAPDATDTDADLDRVLGDDDLAVDTDLLFDGLHFDGDEKRRIKSAVVSAVRSGKHVIFTGPPGTGKTELAENLCRALVGNQQYTGYQLTTATADWSTFDTVGGYMPREEAGGSLEFKPGQVLKRLLNGDHARNELLVIDEINRADIDKAFGQLFTVLSGQRVQLPFEKGGEEVEIVPSDEVDWTTGLESHEYAVPESWRLIATMNSYDKTSLYEMSYAFMRRFTFVRVGPPSGDLREAIDDYVELWDVDPSDRDRDSVAEIWRVMNSHGREIGPAIVKDMLGMMSEMDGTIDHQTTQAVESYVLPQLEGIPERNEIVSQLFETDADAESLRRTASEMLHLSLE